MRSEDSPVLVQEKVLTWRALTQETGCGLEQDHPHFAGFGIIQLYFHSILLTCLRSVRKHTVLKYYSKCYGTKPVSYYYKYYGIKPVSFSVRHLFPCQTQISPTKKKNVTNPQSARYSYEGLPYSSQNPEKSSSASHHFQVIILKTTFYPTLT